MQIMPLPAIVSAPGRLDAAADRDDGAVAHVNVAVVDVADPVVHRQQMRAAHDEFAPRRQARSA
jgi:hypothetical protein